MFFSKPYVNALSVKGALEADVQAAQARRDQAQAVYDEARQRYENVVKQFQGGDSFTLYLNTRTEEADMLSAKEALDGYQDELDRATAAADANADTIAKMEQQFASLRGEIQNAENTEGAVREALDGTMAKVQELTDAYTEAYNAAQESFQGRFGLFDEAKADAEATVVAAQKALDTQLAYWQEYAGNIAALKEQSAGALGVTQENYNALMEYVRSGTPEAAGLAADMVKAVNEGNTQALTDLATTLGEISENQDQAAKDVADWTLKLNEQMDQLILDMGEDIKDLDMGPDAAAAAEKTIQSYIDKAGEMQPQVQAAYRSLAVAAARALNPSPRGYTAYTANENAYTYAYAKGTDNAPPGWSWVGEEGPELMRMHGGERILPSDVSQEVAQTYNAYNQYRAEYKAAEAVQGVQSSQRPALEVVARGQTSSGSKVELHFHVEAGAPPETVSALQEYANSGDLREIILEVIEDAQADERKRALV